MTEQEIMKQDKKYAHFIYITLNNIYCHKEASQKSRCSFISLMRTFERNPTETHPLLDDTG